MTTKLLLVDDSGMARRSMRAILEDAGFDVIEAADGMAADDFGEGVDRIYFFVGNNVEAIATEGHRSFRAHESERAHAG